ncbi:hypothetical protein PROVRUST_04544 [Providencia rustigianii DSM 4541]|uniref:Uncharacterized protein n=1 Tax=Providencia rustigianii DSM 4541 TaxID=500637 RepID=D1NXB6_9GAMM|nr:hypothetical protein PROVRUST_04544 [Providencia rustigianii DSM 4541]
MMTQGMAIKIADYLVCGKVAVLAIAQATGKSDILPPNIFHNAYDI